MAGEFELSRRKVLAQLGTIGVASAGLGIVIGGYFSDLESFTDNQSTAGQIDLKVGWQESYADWSDDETTGKDGVPKMTETEAGDYVGFPVGAPGDEKLVYIERGDAARFIRNTAIDAYPDLDDDGTIGPTEREDPCEALADTPVDLDPTTGNRTTGKDTYDVDAPDGERVRPLVSLADVKPGDFGQIVFPFALCDNPGYVWMNGRLVRAAANGRTEPEGKDSDEEVGDVELLDEVRVALYYADGFSAYAEDSVETFFVGLLRDAIDVLSSGRGVPLDGDRSTSFDEIDGDADDPARECFPGVDSEEAPPFHSVGLSWYLPVDHANEIQTDAVSFDLGFYTEQCRHNDGAGIPLE
jgi:hypothetical protein